MGGCWSSLLARARIGAEPRDSLVLTSTKSCEWMIWYGEHFIPSHAKFSVDSAEVPLTSLILSLEKYNDPNLPADKYAKLTYECCPLSGKELLYIASVFVDDGRHPPKNVHDSGLKGTGTDGACLVPLKRKNCWITIEIIVDLYRNRQGGTIVDIWNDRHQSSSARDILESDYLSDVKIISKDGQEFYAHKLILRARNDVFDAMFRHDMTESQTGVVKLDDMSGNAVKFLLNLIYSGQILNISGKEDDQVTGEDTSIAEVLYLTDKFGLQQLKTFLDENIGKFCEGENVWHLFKLCKLHSLHKGKKVIFDVLKQKNPDFLEEFVYSHA